MRVNIRRTAVIGGGATILAIAIAIPVIAGTMGNEPEPEQPAAAVSDKIEALEENRADLAEQQDRERAQAQSELVLPEGSSYGEPFRFTELDQQIEALSKAGADIGPDGTEPALEWYEDGYFASIVAIDWQCAWLSVGVAAAERGDTDAVAEAVETLQGFSDSRYADAFPDYDSFVENTVEPLLSGDAEEANAYLPSCNPETLVR